MATTSTTAMSREEILAEIKLGRRSVILKTGDNYHDLKAHTAQNFDESPYHIQETAHELIVINRKRISPRPKEKRDMF